MAYKTLFVVYASALLAQISCQCLPSRSLASPAITASSGCGSGASLIAPVQSNGGVLAVTSSSPLTPGGFYVSSDNNLEGNLNVCGTLPHLSAVAFEGQLPSSDSVGVTYNCGENVAITKAGSAGQYANQWQASACGCGNTRLF